MVTMGKSFLGIDTYEGAVLFTMGVLRRAKDWQEGQTALADHDKYGPWLRDRFGDADIDEAQSIIREAEKRLGSALPY